ncbi:hypothetical protein HMPREF9447_00433 [Bacteroides oleiciplenus YIT 12058]|uniref:Uncharacterized protein n=1 Tax=Bacteroides oleiciplenus YIT 12058 TaxID=742727 RepID=K9EAC1_9BACE|nr:hypothetical protein HMPREF9447_00433 [Bacteroides oleiciplenus YIT 12058]
MLLAYNKGILVEKCIKLSSLYYLAYRLHLFYFQIV